MMFDLSTSDAIVVIGTILALFWLFRKRKTPLNGPSRKQENGSEIDDHGSGRRKDNTRSDSGDGPSDGDGGGGD